MKSQSISQLHTRFAAIIEPGWPFKSKPTIFLNSFQSIIMYINHLILFIPHLYVVSVTSSSRETPFYTHVTETLLKLYRHPTDGCCVTHISRQHFNCQRVAAASLCKVRRAAPRRKFMEQKNIKSLDLHYFYRQLEHITILEPTNNSVLPLKCKSASVSACAVQLKHHNTMGQIMCECNLHLLTILVRTLLKSALKYVLGRWG